MKPVYQSSTISAHLDPRGFLELIVEEGKQKSFDDILKVAQALSGYGVSSIRVLISKKNSYSTAADVLTKKLDCVDGINLEKVAFYAPTGSSHAASNIEAGSTLKVVPWKIFADRSLAVDWLLES